MRFLRLAEKFFSGGLSVHKPERRLVACATPMTKGICAGFAAQFEIHAAFFHRLSTNGIDYEIQRVAAPQT